MHQAMTNRKCNSDNWMLGKQLLKQLGPYTHEYSEVGLRDWVPVLMLLFIEEVVPEDRVSTHWLTGTCFESFT